MRLGLGTAQFGMPYGIANQIGQVKRSEVKQMLQIAFKRGIDTLDTAIGYGDSESSLGEAGVRAYKIVTKLPPIPATCCDVYGWVLGQISASMERLGVDYLYGLLLHRSADLLDNNGELLYRALLELKDNGQLRKFGVSIYNPSELSELTNNFSLDLVQAPFNLIDQRLHLTGWLDRLKSKGIEVHTRSVFLQGLLLMKHTTIPSQFDRWGEIWDKWHRWLLLNQASAVEACVAFPLAFQAIDRVIVGADTISQLVEIIDASFRPSFVTLPNLNCEDAALINPGYWLNS